MTTIPTTYVQKRLFSATTSLTGSNLLKKGPSKFPKIDGTVLATVSFLRPEAVTDRTQTPESPDALIVWYRSLIPSATAHLKQELEIKLLYLLLDQKKPEQMEEAVTLSANLLSSQVLEKKLLEKLRIYHILALLNRNASGDERQAVGQTKKLFEQPISDHAFVSAIMFRLMNQVMVQAEYQEVLMPLFEKIVTIPTTDLFLKAFNLKNLGFSYFLKEEISLSIASYRAARTFDIPDIHLKAEITTLLGEALLRRNQEGDLDGSQKLFEEAQDWIFEDDNLKGRIFYNYAKSFHLKGVVNEEVILKYQEALGLIQCCASCQVVVKNRLGEALVTFNTVGSIEEAIGLFTENSKAPVSDSLKGISLYNLAELLSTLDFVENKEKVQALYQEGLTLSCDEATKALLKIGQSRLSETVQEQINLLEEALTLAKQPSQTRSVILVRLAKVLMEQDQVSNFLKIIDLYKEALTFPLQDALLKARFLNEFSLQLGMKGQLKEALTAINQALPLVPVNNPLRAEILRSRAAIFSVSNDRVDLTEAIDLCNEILTSSFQLSPSFISETQFLLAESLKRRSDIGDVTRAIHYYEVVYRQSLDETLKQKAYDGLVKALILRGDDDDHDYLLRLGAVEEALEIMINRTLRVISIPASSALKD